MTTVDPMDTSRETSMQRLRRLYPDALRMAPTYQPLLISDMTSDEFDAAREEGLKRLQDTISSQKIPIDSDHTVAILRA